jgi:16S rRNA (guanine966-N2)-methyltransferase
VGRLRIVAGELKGRRIEVPDEAATRPTGDRTREALFDILGAQVRGARVLDAYSGSGALGFEALSRGAASVMFIESDAGAIARLKKSAERLGVAARCDVRAGRVDEVLGDRQVAGPFDLVLADPPYGSTERPILLALVRGRLAPGGLVVLERAAAEPPAVAVGLERVREARYGRSSLDFYRLSGQG